MTRPIGHSSSGGKKPSTPTIGTASAGNGQATVPFTESTYRGKTNSGTYRATSTPGSIANTCNSPCSSIVVSGLSNGTSYTFTVRLETAYGVNSDSSASSNAVTPVVPSFCPPCQPQPWPQNCTYIAYTCDPHVPTISYEYYDCGGCQTCPGTGGYYQAYRPGICGCC